MIGHSHAPKSREVRLAGLVDRHAIVALAVHYCRLIDERRWDRLSEVYSPDASADLSRSGPLHGLDAIIDVCERGLAPLDATHHTVTNHEIALDGHSAAHRCYVLAAHVRNDAEGGASYVMGGRYEDRLVRSDSGWRITHRDLLVAWTDGNPRVVRP